MTRQLLLFAVATLAACSPETELRNTVRETNLGSVAGCERLGRVKGVPKLFGPFASAGVNDARRAAKRAAFDQGATDVVFDAPEPGAPIYEVNGTAYRC